MINKAMILAAGYGTRLQPITDSLPKALVPFKKGTMISYQIEKLKRIGIKEVVVNTHHFNEQIIKYFKENDFGVKVNIIVEEEILGTGGGVLNAKDYFQSHKQFLLLNVDVFTDFNIELLIEEYESSKPFALLAVQKRNTSRYLEFDNNFNLKGRVKSDIFKDNKSIDQYSLVPKLQLGNALYNPYYAFNGIHIISNEIFSYSDKISYSDIIDIYLEEKKTVKGFDVGESVFIDLGKVENLNKAKELSD